MRTTTAFQAVSRGTPRPRCSRELFNSSSPASPTSPSGRATDTQAHRILLQITAHIHRLDASHNNIGTKGAVALFDGLASARRRFSSLPDADMWGMSQINLASNDIGDDGFAGAIYYVSKDQAMRSLLMQANRVTVSPPEKQVEGEVEDEMEGVGEGDGEGAAHVIAQGVHAVASRSDDEALRN